MLVAIFDAFSDRLFHDGPYGAAREKGSGINLDQPYAFFLESELREQGDELARTQTLIRYAALFVSRFIRRRARVVRFWREQNAGLLKKFRPSGLLEQCAPGMERPMRPSGVDLVGAV